MQTGHLALWRAPIGRQRDPLLGYALEIKQPIKVLKSRANEITGPHAAASSGVAGIARTSNWL